MERERESQRRSAADRLLARLEVPDSARVLEALTHPSFANEHRGPAAEAPADNQRLEFLGDSVLGLCVSELLVTMLAEVDEGQLSMMRASLVNAKALAEIARDLELSDALRLGKGADATGERRRPNVLADALEALVGAVYLDAGLDGARRVVRSLLGDRIAPLASLGSALRDAKSRLQESLQARALPPPRYRVVAEQGPPHAREFWVEVTVTLDAPLAEGCEADATAPDGNPRWTLAATGQGRSKKLAEQSAAEALLARLAGTPG